MPNRLQYWAAARAPWLLALTAALTLLAFGQLVNLGDGSINLAIDPSFESVAIQDDSARAHSETVRRRFGGGDIILVVLKVTDGDLFNTETLASVARLSDRLAAIEGVDSVRSLSNTAIPFVDDGVLRYVQADRSALSDPGLPKQLQRATAANDLVAGQLVSRAGDAAAIVLGLGPRSRRDPQRNAMAARIRKIVDEESASGLRVHVTGPAMIRSAIAESVSRQLRQIVPLIVVIVTGLLALAFPTLHGVVLPIATIVIALLWTMATLSAVGRPLNLVTALVPPLLVTMGLAYCAHVLSEFEALVRGDHSARAGGSNDAIERIAHLLKEVSVPVAVTGLTTIAGLLALLLNEQQSMREFAWLSALGTFYLVLLSLVFVPAALRYATPSDPGKPLPATRLFEAGSQWLVRFDQRWRPQILAAAAVAFVAALYAAAHIQVGDVLVGVFPKDSRIRLDYDQVNAAMGGVNPLEISIESSSADTFTDPSVIRILDALSSWLRAQPEVGAVTGLADHVRLLNRSLGGENARGVPTSRDAIRQMLFVGDNELLRTVVNSDRSSTLIRARLTVDDTAAISSLIERLRPRLTLLPENLDARILGSSATLAESVRTATSGQLHSVALALGLIYICLSVQFMSPRIGLLAALPTTLQTALYFGALGMIGIRLNPTTLLVECLVLGLAVDDTIHYLSRFNSAAKRYGSEAVAAAAALRAVLRPVTLTKAVLALGFLTIVFGELRNQAQFGLLAAMTLAGAWLVDIFVTPAFVSRLRIVTLWDTLRLNLGDRVQETIPLFAGLTDRQARIFALMANLHQVPAGTRLLTEGEESGSIYAVVEGELAVSVLRQGERLEIARLGRGAIVGEHGYFGQKRNANVDAVTQTRLLRFDETDQERLCKSYPAIAARVFLALNRLQAQRHTQGAPEPELA